MRIARWDGAAWAAFGSGFNGTVDDLAVFQGSLVAGGAFTASGASTIRSLARWTGQLWEPLGGGCVGGVKALLPGTTSITAGGAITSLLAPGSPPSPNGIAAWNGQAWSLFGNGVSGAVLCLARLPNGDLVAGGSFESAGPGTAPCLARWNGTSWSSMFTTIGLGSNGREVRAVAVMPDGQLVIGGHFSSINGRLANNIARYGGSAWHPLAQGVGGLGSQPAAVDSLLARPDGELWVGGSFLTVGDMVSPYLAKVEFPFCYANCDASTAPPVLNVADFTCFLQRFAAGSAYANCDASTTPPTLNVADFTCFLQRFAAGCP